MSNVNKNEITTTVAMFTTFHHNTDIHTQGSVIYFWESHTKNPEDKENIQATSNLLNRINLLEYEKYEVRTGYLSRWNYMPKDFDQMSSEEIEESIKLGYEEENEWLKRCEPQLPYSFIPKDWKDCISEKENPYYHQCKQLVILELERNKTFKDAFKESINSYAQRHGTSLRNGEQYVLEEISWIFSLPLVHLNKCIFLVHVGNDNPAIKEMFKIFPNLNKAVKWLRPRLRHFTFQNEADLLMHYNVNSCAGYSYAVLKKDIIEKFKPRSKKEEKNSLGFENTESEMFQYIIKRLPSHIYWVNRENVYLGCNEVQAKDFGLESTKEAVGKTNFDFHEENVASELNRINELVMSTGKPYEGEEPAYINGKYETYLSQKIPIFNIYGKCIGLLGVSFDITDRKEKEELEIRLKLQEELYRIARDVAHDIVSPLTVLEAFQYLVTSKLTDKESKILDSLKKSIKDIAGKMMEKYKEIKDIDYTKAISAAKNGEEKEKGTIALKKSIEELTEMKMLEYRNKGVKINQEGKREEVFIKGERRDFERMMSNIINNGIESVEGKKANIEIGYEVKGEEVEIRVKDNGRGIPKEMVEKLMKGEEIGTTKKEGHGIGTQQIMGTIKEMNGRLKIESKENVGTEFILRFSKTEKAKSEVKC